MKEAGLRAKAAKRKFKPQTTTSNHENPVFPNRLADSVATEPDMIWASDITYIPTRSGWVYLAVVLDLFSRRVVGWSLKKTLKTELPLAALQMALGMRAAPRLHHSDRGSQYASRGYRGVLASHGIEGSMSRKGNCYDNATVESFFHTLKTEFVFHETFEGLEDARTSLFDYIEVFYNRQRSHSSLGYKSPAAIEGEAA
jgi:transposase InsO family protein